MSHSTVSTPLLPFRVSSVMQRYSDDIMSAFQMRGRFMNTFSMSPAAWHSSPHVKPTSFFVSISSHQVPFFTRFATVSSSAAVSDDIKSRQGMIRNSVQSAISRSRRTASQPETNMPANISSAYRSRGRRSAMLRCISLLFLRLPAPHIMK